MNFSENMEELDKILRKLEGDSIPLEEALAEFERGVSIVRECRTFLEETKQKVMILSEEGEREFRVDGTPNGQ